MRGIVVVEVHAEGGEVALVRGLHRGDDCSGLMPAFSAASMIGVPWVSSAQTKCTLRPIMRCARTQMSAWM
jgi:hypothetical protein